MPVEEMYYLVRHYPENFSDFKVLDIRFRATNNPYFCIEFELPTDKQLTLGTLNLRPVEHHLTVPEKNLPSPFRNNKQDSYHYTLVLTDGKDTFKVHVYFDKFDRISLEPSLFKVGSDISLKNQKLNTEQLDALKQFCMPAIAPFMFKARVTQQDIIQKLKKKKLTMEKVLSKISEDQTLKNTSKHAEMINRQIETIKQLEQVGNSDFTSEKRFYNHYLRILESTSQAIAQPIHLKQIETETEIKIETEMEEACLPHQPFEQPPSKPKANDDPKLLAVQGQQLIQNYSEAADKAAVIKKMIEWAVKSTGSTIFDHVPEGVAELFEVRLRLIESIQQYFEGHPDLHSVKPLYLAACRDQLISLSDPFIIHAIKLDESKTLGEILEVELIAETRRLRSTESEKAYTMMEWAVFYKSLGCCKLLMKKGYSFDDYQNDPNSPLINITESPEIAAAFFKLINNDRNYNCRIMSRTIQLLSNEIAHAPMNDPSVPIKKIKLENLQLRLKVERILEKNRSYRIGAHVMVDLQSEALARGYITPARKEEVSNDLDVQNAMREEIEARIDFLNAMKPRYLNLLKALSGSSVADFKRDNLKILSTAASVEEMRCSMIRSLQHSTAVFRLYTEILCSEKTIMNIREDGYITLTPTDKGKRFVAELEALKKEEKNGNEVLSQGTKMLETPQTQLRGFADHGRSVDDLMSSLFLRAYTPAQRAATETQTQPQNSAPEKPASRDPKCTTTQLQLKERRGMGMKYCLKGRKCLKHLKREEKNGNEVLSQGTKMFETPQTQLRGFADHGRSVDDLMSSLFLPAYTSAQHAATETQTQPQNSAPEKPASRDPKCTTF